MEEAVAAHSPRRKKLTKEAEHSHQPASSPKSVHHNCIRQLHLQQHKLQPWARRTRRIRRRSQLSRCAHCRPHCSGTVTAPRASSQQAAALSLAILPGVRPPLRLAASSATRRAPMANAGQSAVQQPCQAAGSSRACGCCDGGGIHGTAPPDPNAGAWC